MDYSGLERALAYTFVEPSLLKLALTHRSYGRDNNERLEFLGDALLNSAIAQVLYEKFPDEKEGVLSRLRAHLVKGETLALIARDYHFGDYVILGTGELKSGGHRRDSILADVVEAIIGAIYLDGGLFAAQDFVYRAFATRLKNLNISRDLKDPKTRLQEYLQSKKLPLPVYTIVQTEGESHNQRFTVSCQTQLLNENPEASASSRRQAEQQAAEKVLQRIQE